MKYVLVNIILFLAFGMLRAQDGEIVSIKNLEHNPGNLKGSIYIPQKLANNSRKKPLVVLLHGCNQSPNQLLSITGFQKYADSLGFYLLMPEQKIINNPSKCFNWFYEKDISHQEEGESRSIVAMIDYAEGNYPIDIYSVHVVGLSAGAAMANALLIHYPNVFNSGAVIAGGPTGQAKNPIEAVKVLNGKISKSVSEYASECKHCKGIRRFPKVMLVHGTTDIVVDPNNLREVTKQWKGILLKDIDDSITNHRYLENEQLNVSIYMDSLGHELLKTISIKNMGHKYPQSRGDCYGSSGEDGLHADNIGYNLTLDIVHYFGLSPRRIQPHRTEDPSWENKYVSLKRYCDGVYYELETTVDSCEYKRFVNYTLSEMNGCSISDYYYIYK
jgi:poly(hydroxyalkanoate) depolymerase family esterase